MNQNQKETDTFETEEDVPKICKLMKFFLKKIKFVYMNFLNFSDDFCKTPLNLERKTLTKL